MNINTLKFIEKCLKIKNKESELVPLVLNPPQKKVYAAVRESYVEGRPIRIIILKARQMGFSTLTEAMIFKNTYVSPLVSSGIVAHEVTATNNLFNMSKRFYDNLIPELKEAVKLKASNAKEVIFENADGNSTIKCMTAGNEKIGRSDTFQNLHISEYAFWQGNKEITLLGLLQAVPNIPNTMVIIESTANGYDDFKERWDSAVAGESDYIPIFCAWHEMPDYRMEYDGSDLTREEQELKHVYDLDNQQIMWRRWCIRNNCGGDERLFRQEYPSCPDEAFLLSGRPVFDNETVIQRIHELEKRYRENPYKEGYFHFEYDEKDQIKDETIEFRESHQRNYIRLYEDSLEDIPYVIGGDTKGEGKDFFAGTVLKNTTGQRVASLHMDLSESKPFTHQMYAMGKYFNTALISIEINFNTAPIEELQRLNYPRQYVRRKYDSFTKVTEEKYGFKTDGNTRPLIIDKAIDIVNNNIKLFTDIPTLREVLTFVYNDRGRPDAMSGNHDDLLMSDMIANECREQQSFESKKDERKYVYVTNAMFEDYNNAKSEDRELLERLWGGIPKRRIA